jgi:signal transduction histidine kinase
MLELIAAQSAPLIENARLWEKMSQTATMEERLRIARDLHDNFLQTLAAIKLHLERISFIAENDPSRLKDAINRVHEIAADGLADVRSYLSQLRLMGPDPAKFAEAAKAQVQESASRGGFTVHPDIDLPAVVALSEDCAVAAYQILRELLNNVVLHARAENVWVRARVADDKLQLTVRDDGIGFDPNLADHQSLASGHLGLIGVDERARGCGGDLSITSTPGSGTIAKVEMPCGKAASTSMVEAQPSGESQIAAQTEVDG